MSRIFEFSRRIESPILLLLTGLLLILPAGELRAELAGPQARDREIAVAVTKRLKLSHLTRHELDDEISQRCLGSFLKSLDPQKLYFYETDYQHFMLMDRKLDNFANSLITDKEMKFLRFAFDVFNTFLTRVDERVAVINELLDEEHDFTIDEEMITDRDELHYARDAVEARERWRQRIKYDLLVQKADEVEGEEAIKKLRRRYRSFAKRMQQTDNDELLEIYLTSLTTSYDPHTTYMSPRNLENFLINMSLKLDGIGAALLSKDGETVVSRIIPGGAADDDGQLKPDDVIVGVAQGQQDEFVDVVDMKLGDVVDMIRGRAGTVVRLKVRQRSGAGTSIYNITRARIELKDSEAHGEVFEVGQRPDGQPYRIGVIELDSFYMDMEGARRRVPDFKSTTRDVRKILARFKDRKTDAVVIDLRKNGGGSLTEAINLTGLFIDRGPVVQVKGADGNVQHYDDPERGTGWDGPLVVLVSKFSASASEIFAGAIKDYGRGLIVGDPATHGKGTVQTLREVSEDLFFGANQPSLGALKLTMQKFYRPNGYSTQNRGVLSDILLPSLSAHLPVGEADLDYAMEFDQVAAAPFQPTGHVDRTVTDQLQALSTERCDRSEDFQKVQQTIERYLERKNRKSVTLNEEKFMAEHEELDTDKEERLEVEGANNSDPIGVKRDYYLDEALAVTLDFMRLMAAVAQAN